MNFFRQLNQFMVAGAKAQAQWELEMSTNILNSRKRLLVLGLLLLAGDHRRNLLCRGHRQWTAQFPGR